jgi:predicted RNase H-like HicB family nuclease
VIYDVILTQENNQYTARSKEWPEVMVTEDSRDAAIEKLKVQLLDYLTNQVEVVQVEIPLEQQTQNPWLQKFGYFKDDPTFEDLQAEIAAYRQEVDQAGFGCCQVSSPV